MKELFFETANLKAYYVTSGDVRQDTRIVVSFRSLIRPGRPYETGESETTIRRAGLDAIHIIPNSNKWYQYPEIHDLLDRVGSITRTYETVATYGLSMGGFGALQASAILDADLSVTYSPQFSVDSSRLDFVDRGWQRQVAGVKFLWDSPENISKKCRHVVIYDPRHTDSKHIAEIQKHVCLEALILPFAGHHTWRTAKHAGIGEKLLRRLLLGETDLAWVRQAVRNSRRTDARYFVNLWRQSARSTEALQHALSIDLLLTMMSLGAEEWPFAVEHRPNVWADVQAAIAELRSNGKFDEAERAEATIERIRRRGRLD